MILLILKSKSIKKQFLFIQYVTFNNLQIYYKMIYFSKMKFEIENMKKFIAIIMCLITVITGVAIAAPASLATADGADIPVIHIVGTGEDILRKDENGNVQTLFPFQAPDGYIEEKAEVFLPVFAEAFFTQEWDEFCDVLYDCVMPILSQPGLIKTAKFRMAAILHEIGQGILFRIFRTTENTVQRDIFLNMTGAYLLWQLQMFFISLLKMCFMLRAQRRLLFTAGATAHSLHIGVW